MGGASYQYDGEGRRVQQTISSTITKYLLDIQPGLAVVLSQTEGSDVTRFVHAPRGIHARQDAMNDWHWAVQDGLGTVRLETDNSVGVEGSQNLDPFGNLIDMVNGDIDTPYGFTGEMVDGSGLLDLRARRYNAGLGTFASLDPLEGTRNRAMSLNGYLWVEGNVINAVDPSGLQPDECADYANDAYAYSQCRQNTTGNACPPTWTSEGGLQQVCYAPPNTPDTYSYGYAPELAWDVYWGNQPASVLSDINNTFSKGDPLSLDRQLFGAAAAVGLSVVGGLGLVGAALFAATPVGQGAILGGLFGASSGYAYGEAMYAIAASGQCGSCTQQKVLEIGRGAFVDAAMLEGAKYGALYGGVGAAGPFGRIAAGTGGVIQGNQAINNAGQDIAANGLNACNAINGLLGVAGVLGGISSIKGVYNNLRSQESASSQPAPKSNILWNASREDHIFRNSVGHVNPSVADRAFYIGQWQDVASSSANYRPDAVAVQLLTQQAWNAGLRAYTEVRLPYGQFWVLVRNNEINNAGVNSPGAYR